MDERTISGISYLKSSQYRSKMVLLLHENILTPADLQSKMGIRLNHVSMHLKSLWDPDIVRCLNEDAKKGRLYQLSEYGNNLYEYIK